MTTLSKNTKKGLLFLFFIAIIGPILEDAFREFTKQDFIISLLGILDEVCVILLFAYSLCRGILKFEKIELLIILFCLSGYISGFLTGVPSKVLLLGGFNTVKALIVYICFRNINFDKKEIVFFLNLVCSVFWIVFVFDLLDFIFPSFRSSMGYQRVAEMRMGLRSISGLMRETHLTILAAFMYFAYTYYLKKGIFYKIATVFMILGTMKVKDVAGFFAPFLLLSYKRVSKIAIIISSGFFYAMFIGYSIILPDHYAKYFGDEELVESQARPVLYTTSISIAKDYFPLGVGFGRYASPISQQIESSVYSEYDIDWIYGLNYEHNSRFMSDVFWPMILGETGFVGFLLYIVIILKVFVNYMKRFFLNTEDLTVLLPTAIFIFLFISSFAKPTFSGPPHSFFVWGLAGMFYNIAFFKTVRLNVNDEKD